LKLALKYLKDTEVSINNILIRVRVGGATLRAKRVKLQRSWHNGWGITPTAVSSFIDSSGAFSIHGKTCQK